MTCWPLVIYHQCDMLTIRHGPSVTCWSVTVRHGHVWHVDHWTWMICVTCVSAMRNGPSGPMWHTDIRTYWTRFLKATSPCWQVTRRQKKQTLYMWSWLPRDTLTQRAAPKSHGERIHDVLQAPISADPPYWFSQPAYWLALSSLVQVCRRWQ